MEITEVKIRLMPRRSDNLKAFGSIAFDDAFAVRDLKVIKGLKGVFIAMPNRKLVAPCLKCRANNHLRANFCNECGAELNANRVVKNGAGRPKLHVEIAHPINAQCREDIEKKVLGAFNTEREKSKRPGYQADPGGEALPDVD